MLLLLLMFNEMSELFFNQAENECIKKLISKLIIIFQPILCEMSQKGGSYLFSTLEGSVVGCF